MCPFATTRRHLLTSALSLGLAPMAAGVERALGPPLRIIDAHVHLFDPTRPGGIPWPGPSDPIYQTTTNTPGFYAADSLVPGSYTIRVSRDGFQQTALQHVVIDPGQTRESSIPLKVGSGSEQVEVTADQIAVETQNSGSGGTISSKQVENMMLNGRNFQSMGQLVPGVSSTAGNNQHLQATSLAAPL